MSQTAAPNPQSPLRRFDVFAEWNRLKGLRQHFLTDEEARAYGLAVAKVVAGRKFGSHSTAEVKEWKKHARSGAVQGAWWQKLGSDEEFRSKVISRMGERFYTQVFAPAVEEAWQAGKRYEDIRDTLREEWNPASTRAGHRT